MRHDHRQAAELRPLQIKRHFTSAVPGSVLIQAGRTTVLCTASVAEGVPPWMAGRGRGWTTAEYGMLPGSTSPRKDRDRGGKIDGRTTEIQRLVGRSLRAVIDLDALGERTVTMDCDVLEADGGTRTLSITGAFIALVDALHAISPRPPGEGPGVRASKVAAKRPLPLRDSVAAVSVGIVDGEPMLGPRLHGRLGCRRRHERGDDRQRPFRRSARHGRRGYLHRGRASRHAQARPRRHQRAHCRPARVRSARPGPASLPCG